MCLRRPPENLLAQAQSGSGKTAAFCLAGLCNVDTRLAMPQVTERADFLLPNFQISKCRLSRFLEQTRSKIFGAVVSNFFKFPNYFPGRKSRFNGLRIRKFAWKFGSKIAGYKHVSWPKLGPYNSAPPFLSASPSLPPMPLSTIALSLWHTAHA